MIERLLQKAIEVRATIEVVQKANQDLAGRVTAMRRALEAELALSSERPSVARHVAKEVLSSDTIGADFWAVLDAAVNENHLFYRGSCWCEGQGDAHTAFDRLREKGLL